MQSGLDSSARQSARNRIDRKHVDFLLVHTDDLALLAGIELDDGPVKVDLTSSCSQEVKWRLFTVSYRKLAESTVTVNGSATVIWNLKDPRGKRVASGMYYLVFEVGGKTIQTRRVMVIH